jgi:hypothetical protein
MAEAIITPGITFMKKSQCHE